MLGKEESPKIYLQVTDEETTMRSLLRPIPAQCLPSSLGIYGQSELLKLTRNWTSREQLSRGIFDEARLLLAKTLMN